eukprot:CAMPEP_0201480356 /NCGR_PEP_ID=MMETSP0151_2-20130828/4842_1 /ASSEMBLY_ACC=CAM_ASM_000257 /TAXON_ID=200890 /ORGANISM="Paramoeba atlantica, Strain 621/1 / CCAP 1560/9" /LENGTH=76 /DNA_ID=CAMNT_0047862171 /DNA_START=59 /DNA_END=289 /DNA_ORIENTATION=+
MTSHLQKNWDDGESVEKIQTSIKIIAEFLSRFDASTRYRLAVINEKLAKLEREVTFLEATIRASAGETEELGASLN